MIIMRAVRALFLGVLVFATAILAAQAAKAEAPRSGTIMVDGPWITLGDLFLVTGAVADIRVFEAPAPGQKTVLVTRRVAAIARDNGIDWSPGASTAITVERAGDLIPRTLIVSSLADALSVSAGKNMSPEISNSGLAIFVPKCAGTALAVENLDFDPDRGNFSAVLIAPAGDPAAVRVEVHGRAYEVTEVPVLIRAVAVGAVIAGADIGWINLRVDRLRSNMITEYALLEGQSPKRPMRVNEPVRITDVQRPVVIAKGATILMVVEAPGIVLTAVGRALTDAGMGETVQVVNIQTPHDPASAPADGVGFVPPAGSLRIGL